MARDWSLWWLRWRGSFLNWNKPTEFSIYQNVCQRFHETFIAYSSISTNHTNYIGWKDSLGHQNSYFADSPVFGYFELVYYTTLSSRARDKRESSRSRRTVNIGNGLSQFAADNGENILAFDLPYMIYTGGSVSAIKLCPKKCCANCTSLLAILYSLYYKGKNCVVVNQEFHYNLWKILV